MELHADCEHRQKPAQRELAHSHTPPERREEHQHALRRPGNDDTARLRNPSAPRAPRRERPHLQRPPRRLEVVRAETGRIARRRSRYRARRRQGLRETLHAKGQVGGIRLRTRKGIPRASTRKAGAKAGARKIGLPQPFPAKAFGRYSISNLSGGTLSTRNIPRQCFPSKFTTNAPLRGFAFSEHEISRTSLPSRRKNFLMESPSGAS